jgi:hypothetical protein
VPKVAINWADGLEPFHCVAERHGADGPLEERVVDDRNVVERKALFFFVVSPEAVAGSGQGKNSDDCDETRDAFRHGCWKCSFANGAMASYASGAKEWARVERETR